MKPYVICHMCTTIDGKILTSRWGQLPGGASAAKLFETTAASFGIDAWIVGTTTMKEFAGRSARLPRAPMGLGHDDHLADSGATSFAIGADAKGVLRFQKADVDGDHVVLLVTEQVSKDYLAHLRLAGVSYLICGARRVDPKVALDKLWRKLGIRKVMLEGGGAFNGAVLAAGLVDEISQIFVPVVDGGRDVTSVFDIPGPPPPRAAATLKLTKHQVLAGGSVWCRYRVVGKPKRAR